jgi:hypothetical protein
LAIKDLAMFEATPQELFILSDIERKTGLRFRLLGGIDTRDEAIARVVLPILAEWPEKIADRSQRDAVYSRFHTPHAYPYLDQIISWWIKEDPLALDLLTQDLALIVKCCDAERVWKLCKEVPRRPFHYMLVSKLATCPDVEREAKDALVHALQSESLRAGDLSYIAKVDDVRIREWFRGQVGSPDPAIRAVAKRVSSHNRPLPKGLYYASAGLDRSCALFSTEEDMDNVGVLLQKLEEDFCVKIPAVIKSGRFLSSVEINRWIVTHLLSRESKPVSLWFRLEDIDTVEINLAQESSERSQVQ